MLATHPGAGFRTLAELVAYAKANPGKLSYASFGNGTSAHLAGEMLALALGARPRARAVQGPGVRRSTDLLGGQVSMMFGNWPEFRGQIDAGKLVAVGMATERRTSYAPAVPTLAEQGAPIESNSWNGVLAPAATPADVVERLNAAVDKALAARPVAEAFAKGELTSMAGTPAQFAALPAGRDREVRADHPSGRHPARRLKRATAMSLYGTQKLLFHLNRDAGVQKRYRDDLRDLARRLRARCRGARGDRRRRRRQALRARLPTASC